MIAWLLEGHRDNDIAEAMQIRWPGQDHKRLLTSAAQHFENAANCDANVVIGWGLEAYKDLYRRMVAIGDFANAMKAVKELVALAARHCVRIDAEETTTPES